MKVIKYYKLGDDELRVIEKYLEIPSVVTETVSANTLLSLVLRKIKEEIQ